MIRQNVPLRASGNGGSVSVKRGILLLKNWLSGLTQEDQTENATDYGNMRCLS